MAFLDRFSLKALQFWRILLLILVGNSIDLINIKVIVIKIQESVSIDTLGVRSAGMLSGGATLSCPSSSVQIVIADSSAGGWRLTARQTALLGPLSEAAGQSVSEFNPVTGRSDVISQSNRFSEGDCGLHRSCFGAHGWSASRGARAIGVRAPGCGRCAAHWIGEVGRSRQHASRSTGARATQRGACRASRAGRRDFRGSAYDGDARPTA
jgi:hypothetical protein